MQPPAARCNRPRGDATARGAMRSPRGDRRGQRSKEREIAWVSPCRGSMSKPCGPSPPGLWTGRRVGLRLVAESDRCTLRSCPHGPLRRSRGPAEQQVQDAAAGIVPMSDSHLDLYGLVNQELEKARHGALNWEGSFRDYLEL